MSTASSLTPIHVLVLNTAEGHLQMAIGRLAPDSEEYELLCAQEWRIVSQGAEMLTPLLLSTLERLHLTLGEISQIACVSGPGSFTGIRLAITTAAGLSRALSGNIKQAGIPFMPLLARNVAIKAPFLLEECSSDAMVWTLTHARRNLVHMQGFSSHSVLHKKIEPATDILVLSLEEAAKRVNEQGGKALMAGSGVNRNRETLQGLLPHAMLLPDTYATVEPVVLMEQCALCSFSDKDIEPAYVRACDAEDNLDAIASSLGLDAKQARLTLATVTGASE